jgi:hypothetical protein
VLSLCDLAVVGGRDEAPKAVGGTIDRKLGWRG